MQTYEMFTDEGNEAVSTIVDNVLVLAEFSRWSVDRAYELALTQVQRMQAEYPEVNDTAVRDAIYATLEEKLGEPRPKRVTAKELADYLELAIEGRLDPHMGDAKSCLERFRNQ